MAYILNTPDDVRAMLATIGLDALDQLFDMIPPEFRRDRPLAIPEALSELELTEHVTALAARNTGADVRPCFLGGGCYDHFIPADAHIVEDDDSVLRLEGAAGPLIGLGDPQHFVNAVEYADQFGIDLVRPHHAQDGARGAR